MKVGHVGATRVGREGGEMWLGCWFSCLSALIPTPVAPCRVGMLACAAFVLACTPLSLRRALPFAARAGYATARAVVSTFVGSPSWLLRSRPAEAACSAAFGACSACPAGTPLLSLMRAASRRLSARLAAAFGCFSAADGDAALVPTSFRFNVPAVDEPAVTAAA